MLTVITGCESPLLDDDGIWREGNKPYTGKITEKYNYFIPAHEYHIKDGNVFVQVDYDVNGIQRTTSIFSVEGGIQERQEYDEGGRMRTQLFFNSAGNIHEKIQYTGEGKVQWREVYSYGDDAAVLETIIFDSKGKIIRQSELSDDRKRFKFDKE